MYKKEHIICTLEAIAEVLGQRYGQREMLLEVLNILEDKLSMHRGTIMLTSTDGDALLFDAARDIACIEGHGPSYQRGDGVTGRVLETGRPAIIPRVSQDPAFRDRIHRRGKNSGKNLSFLCVPIASGDEVIGTLSCDLPLSPQKTLEESKRVLCLVASMIAGHVKARRAARLRREILERENVSLRNELGGRLRPENIIGNSRAMQQVYNMIHQVTATRATVLITGESGTGKELVASAIHYNSPRKEKPFVKLNCAALSENLIESELFGHEEGAFTGATRKRVGRIEHAEGGTLFLDEIGDFSPSVQIKLLRVLQEHQYERVGNNTTRDADVRIIAATNKNIEKAVMGGFFREDLYYRINVFPIHVPPLRKRKSDILQLSDYFVEKYTEKTENPVQRISTEAINSMLSYHWPGNVRELENCIERAVLLSKDGVIHVHNLPPTLQMPKQNGQGSLTGSFESQVAALERDLLTDALKRSRGNMAAAGRTVGLTPRRIRYKIRQLGIDINVV